MPVVVGIAGGACSGKTTISQKLLDLFPHRGHVISLDDFYLKDRSSGPFTEPNRSGQKFFDMNNPLSIDWAQVSKEIEMLKAIDGDLVIVEGIFALSHVNIRNHMSLRIFIDYPDDLRISRKIIRNLNVKNTAPEITFANYLNSGRPGHKNYAEKDSVYADFIIKGEALEKDDELRIIQLIAKVIKSCQNLGIN